jgi:GNAT superfamily N-acetyltransferase
LLNALSFVAEQWLSDSRALQIYTLFMLIQPLSFQTLSGATALVERVFSSLTLLERHSFAASLEPDRLPYAMARTLAGVTQLRYWVLLDPETDRVVGTVGIYCHHKDAEQADWLAMFSIDPDYRGQGLGKRLLNFAINQAQARGKRYLRLYTSTDPKEAVAQTLYERNGFQVVAEERLWLDPCTRIYRELQLAPSRWPQAGLRPSVSTTAWMGAVGRWQFSQALPFQSPLTRLMLQLP